MIYLASPYTHDDREIKRQRFEDAARFAARLMDDGWPTFCPIAHSHPLATVGALPGVYSWWEAYDTWFIERCDIMVILMLDGWRNSFGVMAEFRAAQNVGLPIELVRPGSDSDYEELVAVLLKMRNTEVLTHGRLTYSEAKVAADLGLAAKEF